ncbi:MAG: adenylate/guanylate cyclase domain-containing protein [Cyclobacteriaceae bacterium]|nr:adenylate/guanylate cyclase domain-containing protein [Cyclobacteriaceae bacterium]
MNEFYRKKVDWPVMTECMTESVLITDANLDEPEQSIIYVNPAFERMTGYSFQEVVGKSPKMLQGPATDHGIFSDLKEKLQRGETWSGRTINYKKDGTEFYMEWSIVPIRNEAWIIHQYLAVQKDVTHLVHTEQKLQQAREEELKRLLEIKKANLKLNRLIAKQNKTLDLFTKYVPEPIVKKILAQSRQEMKEGEQLEVGLLFCDIRNFTSLAEDLSPNQVVHVLNMYYSKMSEVIKKHNGVVNQFVGDEIFVSFGAPVPIENPEISAVRCAVDMIKKLKEINKSLSDIVKHTVVVGIGINFGWIIAGNLGSDDRLSYSITGDAVNTAKRIESLTRGIPNAILISENVYLKTKDVINVKPWGEIEMKGKHNTVNVYQIIL